VKKSLKFEFENRIFISLAIVLSVFAVSVIFFNNAPSILEILGDLFGLSSLKILFYGYCFLAISMFGISLLRMWAGSLLSSKTVMSFKVKTESLIIAGPYQLVRNPIYLADLLAMICFSLCLPLIALLIPILFSLHYSRLIKYEEISFKIHFDEKYQNYINNTPQMIPSFKSIVNFFKSEKQFKINLDGLRHNALYLLFIPGFLVASIKQEFLYAVIIGIPGVIDWAIVHTKIGIEKKRSDYDSELPSKKKTKKVFQDILYAQCWEDPNLDRTAFNINEKDVIFSITSGGCNVLSFLIDNPGKIIALDLNPYQNYLLELKIAAFKMLNYFDMLKFVGVDPCPHRKNIYDRIKVCLRPNARVYWDKNFKKIARGIIHCGRFEKYMKLIRNGLYLIIGKRVINQFFITKSSLERTQLFDKKWNNVRWKLFTRVLLSRRTMSLLFDKAFFAFLEESFSFGKHFAQKTEWALKKLPIKENYFLSYILLGHFYGKEYLPVYLRRENFKTIKDRVDRIVIVNDNCEHYFSQLADNYISKFNFSNIFEWISAGSFEGLLRQTIRVAKDGAILTYRNLLVPRKHPDSLDHTIRSLDKLAGSLHKTDLSFIYNRFIVEQINKDTKKWITISKSYQTQNN
jgi:S-adenosylmethionine-diacylglycerol 3-amino-3-carboxypropyl transferase